MSYLRPKVEALLSRPASIDQPKHPEYFEYIYTNEGDLPSSDLIERDQLIGTSEDYFKRIAEHAIHPPFNRPSVDYALRIPQRTDRVITYMSKPLYPETEIMPDFQWVTFKYLPSDIQVAILSLRSKK